MDSTEHMHLIYLILAAAVATFLTRIGGYVMITQMKRIPLIANVTPETSLDRPELRIQP